MNQDAPPPPHPHNKIDVLRVAVKEAIEVFCDSIPHKFAAQVAVTAGDEETDTHSTFILRFKKRDAAFWVWFITADGSYVPAQKAPVRVLIEVVKNLPALRDAIDEAVRAAAARVDDALDEAEDFIEAAESAIDADAERVGGRHGGGGRAPAAR